MPSSRSGRDSTSGARPNPRPDRTPKAGEIYVEFAPYGSYVKVTAIDAATGTEVVVAGPAGAGQAALERVALAKLRRRIEKEKG